jgi:anti-sigma B factor antagonist
MAIAEQELEDVEFGFEVTQTDGLTIVELAGELDLATAAQLRECLTQPEVFDASAVRVDLTKVAFLGSTGIGLLVAACKRARASGGSFQITGSRGMAQRTIEISGLTEYFAQ